MSFIQGKADGFREYTALQAVQCSSQGILVKSVLYKVSKGATWEWCDCLGLHIWPYLERSGNKEISVELAGVGVVVDWIYYISGQLDHLQEDKTLVC